MEEDIAPSFADITTPILLSKKTPVGSSILDVDADDGNGGSVDLSVSYAFINGNEDMDLDGDSPFIIDLNGEIFVNDSDDLIAFGNLNQLYLTITANDNSQITEMTMEIKLFDQIILGSIGDDLTEGTEGNDYLDGDTGRDNLIGGDGDDEIVGGIGADILTGGNGGDTFTYYSIRERGDQLTDFNVNEDILDFSGLLHEFNYQGSDAFAEGYISWHSLGSHTMISVDSDGIIGRSRPTPYILLLNVDATTVTTDNFVV